MRPVSSKGKLNRLFVADAEGADGDRNALQAEHNRRPPEIDRERQRCSLATGRKTTKNSVFRGRGA